MRQNPLKANLETFAAIFEIIPPEEAPLVIKIQKEHNEEVDKMVWDYIWNSMSMDVQHFFWVVGFGLISYIGALHIFNLAFICILIGMIVTFVSARKKGIEMELWKWIVLLGIEACALIYASIASEWWRTVEDYFTDAFVCCARVSMFLYMGQLATTLLVWRRFRRRKNQPHKQPAPPKPPERTFCGDI